MFFCLKEPVFFFSISLTRPDLLCFSRLVSFCQDKAISPQWRATRQGRKQGRVEHLDPRYSTGMLCIVTLGSVQQAFVPLDPPMPHTPHQVHLGRLEPPICLGVRFCAGVGTGFQTLDASRGVENRQRRVHRHGCRELQGLALHQELSITI